MLGVLSVTASERGLRSLSFHDPSSAEPSSRPSDPATDPGGPAADAADASSGLSPHLTRALGLLRRYLDGEPVSFDLPLDLEGGTAFQRRVWERLRQIPFGRVISYGELAGELGGGPGAARAVGGAVGANPLPVVIPCHRVVRADGGLGGFGGGLPRKAALLRLEGVDVEGVGPAPAGAAGEDGLDGVVPGSRVSEEILRLPL